jgi:hypothetical protein
MAAPEVVYISELSQHPREVVEKVEHAPSRSVVIRRRGDQDLLLVSAARAEQADEVASTTTKLFVELMKHSELARTTTTEVLPVAFPWVRFLPKVDRQAFVVELVEMLERAESLGNPAPVAQLIAEWHHTAEVHADPELAAALRADGDDFGPAEAPSAA